MNFKHKQLYTLSKNRLMQSRSGVKTPRTSAVLISTTVVSTAVRTVPCYTSLSFKKLLMYKYLGLNLRKSVSPEIEILPNKVTALTDI